MVMTVNIQDFYPSKSRIFFIQKEARDLLWNKSLEFSLICTQHKFSSLTLDYVSLFLPYCSQGQCLLSIQQLWVTFYYQLLKHCSGFNHNEKWVSQNSIGFQWSKLLLLWIFFKFLKPCYVWKLNKLHVLSFQLFSISFYNF